MALRHEVMTLKIAASEHDEIYNKSVIDKIQQTINVKSFIFSLNICVYHVFDFAQSRKTVLATDTHDKRYQIRLNVQ